MLSSLKVKNYALIENLYVEFHGGLNIITGETGAGKSILLGALGLILGKRADTSVLNSTNEKCIVEAEFYIENYNLKHFFEDKDLDYDDHTVLRREILPSGKSRAFINDSPVLLNAIQELAVKLVDIHSQHQTLQLNKQEFLLGIIDSFCGNEKLLNDYCESYEQYKKKFKYYTETKQHIDSVKADIDFVSFQVEELQKANIQDGELENLEAEVTKLENVGDIKSGLHESLEIISSDQINVLDNLQQVGHRLSGILKVYPDAKEFFDRLESVRIELKDLNADLDSAFNSLDFDPAYFETQKERLDTIYRLFQKYNVNTEKELLDIKTSLEQTQLLGVDGEYELTHLKEEVYRLKEECLVKSAKLSKNRKSAFASIEEKVRETLVDLGILHGKLKISQVTKELSSNGIDAVEFLFSANKNHPLQEISKIASGGELSRLMLAIKALISSTTKLPTLVLDEIDTGVSGEVAGKVGNVIYNMSGDNQIINITHLPQVASKGKAHFKVYKDHDHHTTKTLIKKLDEKERIEEIAKMLSGEELSEAALANARELLG